MKDTLPARVRLGAFDLDLRAGELRASDRMTRLQQQPFQVLLMLMERAGEIVTRDEIQKNLWPNDTMVEFDHSINAAIKNLRRALADSADEPKYVETVARRGYRLLMPVERFRAAQGDDAVALSSLRPAQGGQAEPPVSNQNTELHTPAGAAGLIGKKVSHYRVLQVIGAGGMGLVFKAEDLKLGRQVALKFLPEELAWEPAALRRFEREARYASSLNHPNICTIYEIEEYEGQPFLVMELLEGQTLRDRLAAGEAHTALSLEELLDIGTQVSDGLEAAHEKGIIHRDIKPANIFICRRGTCKILDFGVAKLVNAATRSGSDSAQIGPEGVAREASPHDTTMARTGLGTAGYMSPEQVRGEKLDGRTDLFSFGLVLYEMATGQRAFTGETAVDVQNAIVHRTPAPTRDVIPELPPGLEAVINKALEKDRELRYQSAAEMRADLQWLRGNTESSRAAPSGVATAPEAFAKHTHTTSGPAVVTITKQHERRAAAAVIAVLLVLGVAGFGVYSLLHRPAPMPFQNFTVTQVTNSGKATAAAISPDGKFVLSVMDDNGLQSLWLRNVATGSDTQIIPPSPSRYFSLAFSPDGNYVYFRETRHGLDVFDLYRSPFLGGSPQTVARDIDSDIAFSPDGHRIAYARGNNPEIGKYRLLTATLEGNDEKVLRIRPWPSEEIPEYLAWSPSGNQIAYSLIQPGSAMGGIDVFDLDAGKAHRLAVFDTKWVRELRWSRDGRQVFVNYKPKGPNFERSQIGWLSSTGGDVHPITRDANNYQTLTASADGRTLATVQTRTTANIYLVPGAGSPSPHVEPLSSQVHDYSFWNWTADGDLLVSDGARLWRMGTEGKNETQLLADPNALIHWPSACGSPYLVFTWYFHEGTNSGPIWRVNADGSNAVRLTSGKDDDFAVCSPDQKWVYYFDRAAFQIRRAPLDGSGKPEAVPGSSDSHGLLLALHNQMAISADGKLLAFFVELHNAETAQAYPLRVALLSLDSSTPPRLLDSNPNTSFGVKFTPDGKGVAYLVGENGVDNVWVQPLDGSAGRQITNFKSDHIESFHWSPDGKTLGLMRYHSESDVVLLQEAKP